jgi:hypothetical protein
MLRVQELSLLQALRERRRDLRRLQTVKDNLSNKKRVVVANIAALAVPCLELQTQGLQRFAVPTARLRGKFA